MVSIGYISMKGLCAIRTLQRTRTHKQMHVCRISHAVALHLVVTRKRRRMRVRVHVNVCVCV